jgi:hypothetical protein
MHVGLISHGTQRTEATHHNPPRVMAARAVVLGLHAAVCDNECYVCYM